MNGPLTGTDVNMSGRMAVVTKSPLTGTVTDSHHGGWSAARLKWAGFDGLVFKGKSEKPVYAYVENGKVTLHDASDLWGKHVHETIKILQERHGGAKDLSVITIGPAGENLVKFANWMNENDRASGRGGTGCVGGSKQLKAIVIKGTHANRPRPADKEAFKEAQKLALSQLTDERVITSPRKGGLSVYGTNSLMNDHQRHRRPAGAQRPAWPASAIGPSCSAASMSRSTSWSMTPPAMPARWPARRKSRSPKGP